MAITVSAVALFGLVLLLLLRGRYLGPGSAFTAGGFGFFLASTGAAEPITHVLSALAGAIPGL
ncbi:hypothetical protein G3I76_20280 [Streptomyces sp. SID11233]|uniref:hypothetical protein n=1 Tax=Streptomyces sp. SID11385 TaxID=2706031 RepID=UPI0013BF23BD|nr:hypothetical protein [Streptomyces sp. SID11385]NEA43511.1 hypothetical protein [Streptomyces sp. SID11385]NED82422.1 hypothetical protein [Streptomyces sp. SID11233]